MWSAKMRVFDLLKTRIEKMEEKRDVNGLILALQDDDKLIRQKSVLALGKLGSKEGVGPLIEILQDPDKELKEDAIAALGKIKDPQATLALINALNSPYSTIRWRAAQALGKIGSTEAIEPLTQTLQDPDEEVKEEAITALGRISIKPFIKDLNSNDVAVKEDAILKINLIQDLKVLEISKKASLNEIQDEKDPPQEVKISNPVNLEEKTPENQTKTLKTAVTNKDFEIRRDQLVKDGYYHLVENFIYKYRYDMKTYAQKTDYDYQLSDLQKLKKLLKYKGITFQNEEILWLIQDEIKKQDYLKFKNKLIENRPSTMKQFIENYIKNYPYENPQNLENLKKLLQEHKIQSNNLEKEIQRTRSQKEVQDFEKKLLQHDIYSSKKSPTILVKFVKNDLKKKWDSLILSEGYHYIKNFVNKSKYDYQFSDVQKLKDLLEYRGLRFQDEELIYCIREEINEQDYQDFKNRILKNQPSNLEQYLENFIKNYDQKKPRNNLEYQENTQELENLKKLLQNQKIPTSNLKNQLQQFRSKMEIEEFEHKLTEPLSSETIPPLESKVNDDKDLKNAKIMFNIGNLLYDLGKPDDAMEYYNKSISTYPEIIETWKNKGLLFYTLGLPQKAAACYNHILILDPRNGDVWLDIGLILYDMGELKEAKICYQKALKMETINNNDFGSNTRNFLQGNPFYLNIFQNFMDIIPSNHEESDSISPISRIIHLINE